MFDDFYEDAVEDYIEECESRIENMAEMAVKQLVDDIIDNTTSDVAEKQSAVCYLFTEPSLSLIVTPPGTLGNVIIQ